MESLAIARMPNAAPALRLVPKPKQVRVLVADDDAFMRKMLQFHFEKRGWIVTLAADGEAAKALLSAEDYDLVLLDQNMPFQGGFDLLLWLRDEVVSAPRMVLTSEQQHDATAIRAFALGADDFIAKPLNPEVVALRLERLLSLR